MMVLKKYATRTDHSFAPVHVKCCRVRLHRFNDHVGLECRFGRGHFDRIELLVANVIPEQTHVDVKRTRRAKAAVRQYFFDLGHIGL